jgi:outer membrane protein assembly factor BamB
MGFGARMPRSRTNFLTVYDVNSGRVIWRMPDDQKSGKTGRDPNDPVENAAQGIAQPGAAGSEADRLELISGGFMGSPLVVESMVYVAHNQSGAIYVYCLDDDNKGKVIWRTYLCDEPDSGAAPWAPISITGEGSDLFVGSGMGVVFCLDQATGNVRYAHRYERSVKSQQVPNQFGGWTPPTQDFDGWSEDLMIPWGREMICLTSDASKIISLDRRSGDLVWQAGIDPLGERFEYILGIHNRVLYAAGRRTIVAIDLDGHGRMLWGGETMFGQAVSGGKGILTWDSIYIPVAGEIWQYGLNPKTSNPEPLARFPVNMGIDVPVGNLTSDGNRIWVQAANRIFVLDSEALKSEESDSNQPEAGGETELAKESHVPGSNVDRQDKSAGAGRLGDQPVLGK